MVRQYLDAMRRLHSNKSSIVYSVFKKSPRRLKRIVVEFSKTENLLIMCAAFYADLQGTQTLGQEERLRELIRIPSAESCISL